MYRVISLFFRRIIHLQRKPRFLICSHAYIVLRQPSQTCHRYLHICLLTKQFQVALVGPFQEHTFSAEEYTEMYQNLPDWTHIYGQHFGFTKAEKKGSTYLPLPRKFLITKEITQGNEKVFPLLSSKRHETLLKFSRKHSWRVIFLMLCPTTHNSGSMLAICGYIPLCPISTWKKVAAVHHLPPSRHSSLRKLSCDFLQ